jgi:hypothetical protein
MSSEERAGVVVRTSIASAGILCAYLVKSAGDIKSDGKIKGFGRDIGQYSFHLRARETAELKIDVIFRVQREQF